jgi:hypothetical protein
VKKHHDLQSQRREYRDLWRDVEKGSNLQDRRKEEMMSQNEIGHRGTRHPPLCGVSLTLFGRYTHNGEVLLWHCRTGLFDAPCRSIVCRSYPWVRLDMHLPTIQRTVLATCDRDRSMSVWFGDPQEFHEMRPEARIHAFGARFRQQTLVNC